MANKIQYQVGFDVDSKSLKSLRDQLTQIQKMTSKDFMKLNPNSSLSEAKRELKEIQDTARKVDEALDKAFNKKLGTTNLQEFRNELKGIDLNTLYGQFSKAGAAGQSAFRNMALQLTSVNTQMRESHSLLDKMATTLGNTIKWNIASGAINGLTRSVEQAWGYVKSLDGSLNDIRIVTGKSSDEMAKFAVQANNAAKELGKTTTDYTNAALIYAQQGLNDQQIAERAAITLKTANVTGQSTADVSEELTAVWNGYKVNAEQAELYVDRLAAVAATTASDLEELSTGMSKVASAAAAMGVGEEQLAAQLSTIISATRQAPESVGTALRTVYARISDIQAGIDEDGVTLGNYSGKMADLGFNVLDATGHLRDMGEVMEEIGGKWETLTREQQVNLAQTMAGQRQYNNLLALFDNFDKYNAALNTAQNAAGTLQEQQDIYMESTAAHLYDLKASVEDVYDSFMNRDSLDTVNNLIDALSDGATVIANFVDSLGGGVNILSSLGSLGITVFSRQIAGSIQTTINNLTQARQQAQAFRSAIENAQKIENSGQGNDYTRSLLNKQSELLNMGGKLSQQDFNVIQKNISDLSSTAGQIEQLQQKIAFLEKIFEQLGPVINEDLYRYETLDEALGSADGIQIIKKNLKDFTKAFDPTFKALDGLRQKLNVLKGAQNWNDSQKQISSIRKEIEILFTTLQKQSFQGKNFLNLLPNDTQKKIQQLQTSLNNLNWKNLNKDELAKNATEIDNVLKQLKDALQKRINEINQALKSMNEKNPKNLEALKEELIQLNALEKQLETGLTQSMEKAQSNIKVQDFVNLAGGIAQIGSSIQQLQTIGDIWANNDLDAGQKFLQIITNLSFSLPMLISGLQKASLALGLFKTAQEAATFSAAAGAKTLSLGVISFKAVTTAAGEGAVAVQLFDKAFVMTKIGIFIAGVTAAAAAIYAVVKAWQAYNKKQIEIDKAAIEEQNQKQQEIQKNKELYDSIENLNNQYERNEITRGDLKSGIQDLIDQYGLEGKQVKQLTDNYQNLTETLKTLREEQATDAINSNLEERDKAQDLILRQARQGRGRGIIGDQYTAEFANDASIDLESRLANIVNRMSQYGATQESSTVSFTTDYDIEHIIQLYDEFSQIKKELINSGQQETKQYKQINEWLQKNKDAVENYKTIIEDLNANEALLAGNAQNFNNITNIEEYQRQRQALIQTLSQSQNVQSDDLGALADTYISQYFEDLYNRYGEATNYIEKLQERFQGENKEIEELLSKLSPDQLAFLESIKLDDLTGWEDLKDIVQYLTTADLSNLQILTDPDAAFESASSQYDLYSSLSDQISSSKKQTISSKEYKTLAPEVQEYFSMMANGQYKMTGDAKEFYDTVNNLSIEGFKKNIADLENSTKRLERLQNIDYDKLKQVSFNENEDGTAFGYNKNDIQTQLDYLTETGYDINEIIKWQAALSDDNVMASTLRDISAAMEDASDQTDEFSTYLEANRDALYQNELAIGRSADSFKTLKQYLDDNLISQQAYTQAAIELDKELDTQNLDTEELDKYSDHLQEIAKQSIELSDELETNQEAADIVAKGVIKMNDAIDTLADNWDDWSDVLKNSSETSEEYADAMASTKETVADLLDISKDYVSEDFIKNHLDDITQAATGSEDAIDNLKSSLAEDIVTKIIVENGIDETAREGILSDVANLQAMIPDIEVGATIDDGNFLAKANQLIQDCGMTVDQANAMFDALGFEANFKTEPQQVTQRVPKTVTETQVTGYTSGTAMDPAGQPVDWTYPILQQFSYNNGYATQTGIIDVPAMATNGKTPIINSLTRKAGGGFNSYSGGNSGGKSPGKSSGKKGGSGGKKGGSGKSAQPDTSQKDLKKLLEDERDIYHDINIELEQVNRALDRVQKQQDRLYGKQLIDNLNKQSKILEEHKKILGEKQDLQKQDLKQQQQSLKNLGVMFDQYGNITNYMDLLGHKQAEINALIKQENSLIQAYNKSTDQNIKKQISDNISTQEKRVKAAQDEYKDLQDRIKNYDKLREDMEDLVDQIEEETQKQIEINIKKFRMEVEIRLEMGQAERDWNEFRRKVLENNDIIKNTDFQQLFGDAAQSFRDIDSYFNVHGSIGTLEMLTNQLMNTRAQIEAINKTGKSAIYGDNKAQAMEDLQNDLKELMDQMEDIQSLIDDIDKAYLDTIDDIDEQFDKQIEDYEFIQDLIEHDIDLLQLLYGDKNYDAMQKYYETLTRNNLNQLDSLKKQRDFWKEEWDAAVARGDTQAAEQFEQKYKKTIKNLNQVIENSAKTLQDKYVNAIDKIFDELDKKISNNKGTDYLSTEWDLMNKNADEYLDTINTVFAIQDTERQYQKALDDTKSIKNQQALKNLMDEQLDILKNKEKVTQYDIDRAQKLLQVEQARIALEDAQSAKTTLRLKRDSQGNYSYQYMADNGAIDDAKDNLAQAQNDLYNFDLDRYKQNLNDMLSAWRDFQQEYKEILEDASLSDEDRMQRLALLREQYGEYINNKTEENVIIRNNLRESAFKDIAALYNTDVANYKQMSLDEQNILMEDLVPAWKSGIQQMSDKVAGEGGFIPTCEDAFEDIKEETQAYKEELQDLADAAGVNLNDIQNGVDLLAQAFEYLVEKNDDLIDRMDSQMFAIEALRDQARALVNDYNDVYNSAANAVIQLHQFVQAEQAAAAAYKGTADAYENMVVRMQRANQAYASNPYGGFAPSSNSYSTPSGGGSSSSGGGSGSSGSGYSNRSSSSSSSNFKSTGQRISDYWKTHKGSSSSGRSYGASGGCFVAGTKILMSDKTSKNIEDVNINDIVYAYNQKEKKYEHKKVTNVFVHVYAEGQLVKVTFSNNMVLQMTLGHPVLTTTGWKSFDAEASMQDHNVKTTMLELGDEVITINGNIIVKKIEFIPYVNTFKVYNIEVKGCHTYLANEVVVHNKYNRFATGGYTGEWGSEAKWALLDEKELVLNRQDTQNILDSVKLMRSIVNSLNVSASSRLSDLSSPYQKLMNDSKEQIEQNVHIEASFPNVDSKREIEEAFTDLVNLAAQRAMRR